MCLTFSEIQDIGLVFGLLLNLIGSVALFAFDWDRVRELGYYLKPEYKHIDEGLYELSAPDGELLPRDGRNGARGPTNRQAFPVIYQL